MKNFLSFSHMVTEVKLLLTLCLSSDFLLIFVGKIIKAKDSSSTGCINKKFFTELNDQMWKACTNMMNNTPSFPHSPK